jgi:hypothetical protein
MNDYEKETTMIASLIYNFIQNEFMFRTTQIKKDALKQICKLYNIEVVDE